MHLSRCCKGQGATNKRRAKIGIYSLITKSLKRKNKKRNIIYIFRTQTNDKYLALSPLDHSSPSLLLISHRHHGTHRFLFQSLPFSVSSVRSVCPFLISHRHHRTHRYSFRSPPSSVRSLRSFSPTYH